MREAIDDRRPILYAAGAAVAVLMMGDMVGRSGEFHATWATASTGPWETAIALATVLLISAAWGWSIAELRSAEAKRRFWFIVVLFLLTLIGVLSIDAVPGVPSASPAANALVVLVPGSLLVPLVGWRWLLLLMLLIPDGNMRYFGMLLMVVGIFATPGSLSDAIGELWPRPVRE